jgi:hypothetical protein
LHRLLPVAIRGRPSSTWPTPVAANRSSRFLLAGRAGRSKLAGAGGDWIKSTHGVGCRFEPRSVPRRMPVAALSAVMVSKAAVGEDPAHRAPACMPFNKTRTTPMANVTADFVKDPETFLKDNIVIVPEPANKDNTGPRDFWFSETGGLVSLKAGKPGDGAKVSAYWLSWASHDATSLVLDGEADFFFTSQMTGCRFKVLSSDAKKPKVAHIAGDLSKSQREAKEVALLKTVDESVRVTGTGTGRRLSVSGGKTHEYTGQVDKGKDEDHGSAFVFGVKDGNADWSFKAQIVKANLADQFKLNIARKNGFVPRIAELYEFK